MNCIYHIENPITLICISPHKCQFQRKLCVECQQEHRMDLTNTVPIKLFQDIVTKKITEFKLNESNLNNKTLAIKNMLSQIESTLRQIQENLFESIREIYSIIENQNKLYVDIINKNKNPAESSNTDLEKLVSIVQGTLLKDWNDEKNLYLKQLEKIENWWIQEIKAFQQNSNKRIYKIQTLIKIQHNQEESEVYQKKEDLYEIFAQIQDIDLSVFKILIEILRNCQISDLIGFLSKKYHIKFYKQLSKKLENLTDLKKNIRKITHFIRDIQDHHINKNNYSMEDFGDTKKELISQIQQNKKIIELLKFLIHLTAIDSKFIQCGSNSLHILVDMQIDFNNQSFEQIRIKNTSIVGAKFIGSNLSGSMFDNVNISGINLNGAQLFNCQWKKLKINELHTNEGHSLTVCSISFSPDGTTLASGSYDNSIRLWDVKTGKQKAQMNLHNNWVYSVCFSPDGSTLASCSKDKSIQLWDVETGQCKKLDGHTESVLTLSFSPDSNSLASGSADNSIRLWDAKAGSSKGKKYFFNLINIQAKLYGHTGCINSVCFSPDPDSYLLASGSADCSIRLWDVRIQQQKAKLDGHTHWVESVCFSPDGITLASCSGDKTIRLWDIKTGQQKAKLDGHSDHILSICFSPDGTNLASGSQDKTILLWVVKSGQQKSKLEGHQNGVQSLCFSPDGSTLASCSDDKSIRFWDFQKEQQKPKFDGHTYFKYLGFESPYFTTLATCSMDNSIYVWDTRTGQKISKLDGDTSSVRSICFSPDNTIIATRNADNTIKQWHVRTGKVIKSLDQILKDILVKFKIPFGISYFSQVNPNIPILVLSTDPYFLANGALILRGEFVSSSGEDLRTLFKQRGSCILGEQQKKQQS